MARGPQSKVHADALAILERDEQILEMRAELRMTEWQIAEKVGLSQGQVSRILHRMRKERIEAMEGRKDMLLQDVLVRHDKRYQILLGIAKSEEASDAAKVAAIAGMRAEDDSLCKRLGLDAPTRVEHTFRQDPLTPDELARLRAAATPEELLAISTGDDAVMRQVLERAGVSLH